MLSVWFMMSLLLFGSLSPLPAGTPAKPVSDVQATATAAAVQVAAGPGVGDGGDQQGRDDQRDDERDDRVAGAEDRGGDEAADDRADDADEDRQDDADPVPARDQQVREPADHEPDEKPDNNGGQCNCHGDLATPGKGAYSTAGKTIGPVPWAADSRRGPFDENGTACPMGTGQAVADRSGAGRFNSFLF